MVYAEPDKRGRKAGFLYPVKIRKPAEGGTTAGSYKKRKVVKTLSRK